MSDLKLSLMFGMIVNAKYELKIVDYSLSQTSIGQVFINLSKKSAITTFKYNSKKARIINKIHNTATQYNNYKLKCHCFQQNSKNNHDNSTNINVLD